MTVPRSVFEVDVDMLVVALTGPMNMPASALRDMPTLDLLLDNARLQKLANDREDARKKAQAEADAQRRR